MTFLENQICKLNYPVLTMGTFDGVHKGHQKLIKKLVKTARAKNGEAVVLTYYHHPLETIHRKTFPYLLTENAVKEKLLYNLGIDCILYLNFTPEMAAMEPEKFLKKIILQEIGARELVIGYDTHFGKDRKGDYKLLKELACKYNYKIDIVEPYRQDNRIISSSIIRDLVREGNMQKVKSYLGRNYSIVGQVVSGHKIGKTLGYPTVNLKPAQPNKLIPAIGVYICNIRVKDKNFAAATNIGYSPTLKKNGIKSIESYILDFNEDLYNSNVELYFLKKIRDEFTFSSKQALIKQIGKDVETTKNFYKNRK
ncbi:MAG: riboflavin kinase / adenylyltransferase [Candidatus Cloacimonadota bacterium]|nr:riboflavin kinase / adenylyltransferase [Candidatus Cloacimonadota bacterium]